MSEAFKCDSCRKLFDGSTSDVIKVVIKDGHISSGERIWREYCKDCGKRIRNILSQALNITPTPED